jgi:hypothetical protein
MFPLFVILFALYSLITTLVTFGVILESNLYYLFQRVFPSVFDRINYPVIKERRKRTHRLSKLTAFYMQQGIDYRQALECAETEMNKSSHEVYSAYSIAHILRRDTV